MADREKETDVEPESFKLTISDRENEESLGTVEFNLPHARFQMAKWVLISLFGLLCFLIAYRIFPDGNPSEDMRKVFDKAFDSIVPIASLILGYYFGSSNGNKD